VKTSHKLFIATGLALPFVGLAGVMAHASVDTTSTGQDSFITKLATKFNLNKTDVQTFFSDEKSARQSEMQTKVSDALKAAGFTDAQVSALQTKQTEQRTTNEAWRTANPNATAAERTAHRDSEKVAMDTWAKDQGIDLTKVQATLKVAGVGHMGGRGHGGRGMMGGMMDDGDTPPADAPAN
jgi:hypothetical protein